MELELLVTGANFINKKSGRPRLHQIRRQPKTEKENHLTKRVENVLTKGIKSHVNGEIVPIRRVVTGILPSVRTTFHKQDADMAKHVLFDMLSWWKSPTRSRRKVVRMDQLQVRDFFLLTKSVPIRHQITSTLRITWWVLIDIGEGQGISKKPHGAFMLDLCRIFRCAWFRWYDSAANPDWLWRRSRVIVSEGQCRSGHQRRSVLRVTADKSNVHLCEGQLWTSKSHTVLSCWTSGRPPDSVMDFRLTFEEGQAWLFVKLTSYTWQSQCRSRHQRGSRHLEKATRCFHAWPLQDLSLRLISLARFRRDSVRFRRLHPTDSTTIFDQADDYQEKASLSVSEQVPHEKSRSSGRKSAAGTVPTAFGSSAGHSFGKPQRDCVSETSLLSQLAGYGGLESRSVSTTDEPLMTGKIDRGESIGQSMRDRENLHKILERKAESSIQGENDAQKNYQRLKLMWKLEGGSKEVQKLLYMNPIENLKLKDYSFFRRKNGTRLKAKELVCVENWKWGTSSSKKVAQKIAEKLKNCEGVAVKRVTELDKQN